MRSAAEPMSTARCTTTSTPPNRSATIGSRTSASRHVACGASPRMLSIATTFLTASDDARWRTSCSPTPCAAPVTATTTPPRDAAPRRALLGAGARLLVGGLAAATSVLSSAPLSSAPLLSAPLLSAPVFALRDVVPLRRARTCVSSVSIGRPPRLPWAAWVPRVSPESLPCMPVMCPSCPRSRRE